MELVFGTVLSPPYWEQETLHLIGSLRRFGGGFSQSGCIAVYPEDHPPSPSTRQALMDLNAALIPAAIDPHIRKFPLGLVPWGAAVVEESIPEPSWVAWLLPDTLILKPPEAFVLPAEGQLGYRPVHHRNIGQEWGQAVTPFWQQIYSFCHTDTGRLFEMQTCFREAVQPYFNTGLLITRTQKGLMSAWLDVFRRGIQEPAFQPFFQDQRTALFFHQAILAGVLLHYLEPHELVELPESYNYPLHMHADYPPQAKPDHLFDLVTARFESTSLLPQLLAPFPDAHRAAVILT